MVGPRTWREARRSLGPHQPQGGGQDFPGGQHPSVPTGGLRDLPEREARPCERPDGTGARW
jgi:hypothetical protein